MVCPQNQQCVNGTCTPTSSAGCGPQSCPNGCCKDNQCYGGVANTTCGQGGVACVDCTLNNQACDPTNQACKAQSPPPASCGPQSCPGGCCQNGQCVAGTSDGACGSGGNSCQTCSGGYTCIGQQCTYQQPPSSSYAFRVVLVGAKLLTNPWLCCAEANCDMYVKLKVGSLSTTSGIASDENNPTWNEELMIASTNDLAAGFHAKVYDDDYGPDPKIADCGNVQLSPYDVSGGFFTVKCTSLGDIVELAFSFQPN